MSLIPQLLLPLISFIVLFAFQTVSQDTTSFSFESFDPTQPNLTFQGDAHVPLDSTSLRLTRTDASGTRPYSRSVGRVLYSTPVLFWDLGRQASFETNLTFLITPVDNRPADGLTFFIAPVGSTIPDRSWGGLFGLIGAEQTRATFFAVEFDTYRNTVDLPYPHVGIAVNSMSNVFATRFDPLVGHPVTARINYDAATRTVTVATTVGQITGILRHVLDLKTVLPRHVQVGISSSTGMVAAAVHDVQSWNFTSNMVSETNVIQQVV